jgi:hypothetical protein
MGISKYIDTGESVRADVRYCCHIARQGEADGDGDGEGSEEKELSLRDTLRSWKQQRRKGLAASRRWMRWNSARSTLPLSSQLLIYAAIIAAFACLTAFVILGAVAFGESSCSAHPRL